MKKKNIILDFLNKNGIDKFMKSSEPQATAYEQFSKENKDVSYSYFVTTFNAYESCVSKLPQKLTTKNLSEVIDNFPRKCKYGFTAIEVDAILKKYGVDKKKYSKEMGINTCMMVDGEIVNYDNDVEKSIRCVLEGRTKNVYEWD